MDDHTAAEFNGRGDGNHVVAGQVLPAVIVAVWTPECVNLKVIRDANTDGWVTSVSKQHTAGATRTWDWPARN